MQLPQGQDRQTRLFNIVLPEAFLFERAHNASKQGITRAIQQGRQLCITGKRSHSLPLLQTQKTTRQRCQPCLQAGSTSQRELSIEFEQQQVFTTALAETVLNLPLEQIKIGIPLSRMLR